MRVKNPPWPARDGELQELVAEGLAYSEIARRMALSKNSVVGRAHRLHCPERPSPIKRRPDSVARAMETRRANAELKKLAQPIPTWRIGADQCRFIRNDDMRRPDFCAEKAIVGKAWCPAHYAETHLVGAAALRELKRLEIIAGNKRIGMEAAHLVAAA